MKFRTRALRADDLRECVRLLCQRAPYAARYQTEDELRLLIESLSRIIKADCSTSRVVESADLPLGERIVTFGVSAFVRPEWLCNYLEGPTPLPGPLIIEKERTSPGSVLLTDREVALANSTQGLCAVTLALGWAPNRIPPEHLFSFRQWGLASFREAHDGYRLVHLISECLEGAELDLFLSSDSWQIRSNYSCFNDAHSDEHPRPVLVGRSKAEAEQLKLAGATTTSLFVWKTPRYGFSRRQQQLLLLAREYFNDKELALALRVGEDAVGRRWQRIFNRVQALQPGDDPVFPGQCDSRGKRTRLLLRLEKEMHELRPHTFVIPIDG